MTLDDRPLSLAAHASSAAPEEDRPELELFWLDGYAAGWDDARTGRAHSEWWQEGYAQGVADAKAGLR